ncbi:unnamed protein product [Withania somnifera]
MNSNFKILEQICNRKLAEVLSASFRVLYGKRPKQKVRLLKGTLNLKRRRSNGGKYNFPERLLGVAHPLSRMVEPMLRAAAEISALLARSFFMGFSLTVLSLLARIRVLVQQMLLDVVCVFNNVSSLSQREQAIKLTQEGFEVFREYFPQKQQVGFLECIWKSDKYVLVERKNEKDARSHEKEAGEDVSVEASKIQYESIGIFLGDDEPGKTASKDSIEDGQAVTDKDKANSLEDPMQESNDESRAQVDSAIAGPSGSDFDAPEAGPLPSSSPNKNPAKTKHGSRNNVAFVSVKRPKVSTNNELGFDIHGTEKGDNPGVDKDPFFSLLFSGNMKSSLF